MRRRRKYITKGKPLTWCDIISILFLSVIFMALPTAILIDSLLSNTQDYIVYPEIKTQNAILKCNDVEERLTSVTDIYYDEKYLVIEFRFGSGISTLRYKKECTAAFE